MRTLAGIAVLFAALALVAGGCGGGKSSTTTTTVATTQWADTVCSSLVTWTTTMKSLASTLKSNPTKSGVQDAVNQAKTATQTLADSLKALGKPNTAAGQQAKDDLTTLSDELSKDIASIESSVKGASGLTGLATALADSAATLTTMGKQVSATFGDLQKLDAKGELEKAFSSSASCKQLTG